MSWGTITVAGVPLRETVRATQDGDSLKVAGQESHPPSTRAAVEAVHDNINALELGVVVPVVFTDKAGLTGFYRIVDGGAVLTRIQNGLHVTVDWSIDLLRVGGARDVEVESRVPTIARTATVGSPPAAVFWHAPAGGSGSYFTGPVAPSGGWVDRLSADGPVRVHLGLPAGVAPRWTVPAEAWMAGAARVLFSGIRRVGEHTPPLSVWEVTNGLVRLTPGASGAFTVECWDSGVWRSAKSFQVTVGGVAVADVPEMTVLRNEPEEVAVRLTYAVSPGRLTVDLSLRRGARFVTGVIKRHSAATLGLTRTAAEAATVVTGGLRATAADGDGNRFVLGSMLTVTTTTATASISKASVTALDFFAGHEVDAVSQAGDAFADLWAQYRGSSGARTKIVTR